MQSNVLNQNGEPENRELLIYDNACKQGEILTYTGRYIDALNPDISRIHILDIAHALSNLCRFGGHCPSFYSVAEHSLLVADLMEDAGYRGDALLVGLLHDSEEAYLIDIPSPIKRQFPDYAAAGVRLRKAIFESLGIDYSDYKLTAEFDQQAYAHERKSLWSGYPGLYPVIVKEQFLKRFNEYA